MKIESNNPPAKTSAEPTLDIDKLIAAITKQNTHLETITGPARGKET